MFRIELDLSTGKEVKVYLSQQEIEALQNIIQPTVIREIDARRLRLALHQLNLLNTVETAIATLGRDAQIEWEYATIIKENYPLVISLSTDLGLNVSEIFDIAIAIK
jgi:hypothetical protein